MNEENLINYYNKFYEEKRLKTRHGQVEFITTIKYIEKYLKPNSKILDIGAGSGTYSKYFQDKGYSVTAIELIKHNCKMIEEKGINVIQGNATDISFIKDNSYDIVLLFGPMYHLISNEEKIKALEEAKRVLKDDGLIFISYIMNDYAVIAHGFMEKAIIKSKNKKQIDDQFKITPKPTDLYSYVTIDDINYLNNIVNLKRIQLIAQDGAANYIRYYLNQLSEEEFNEFIKYHLLNCERLDLLGSSAHLLDIIKKDN